MDETWIAWVEDGTKAEVEKTAMSDDSVLKICNLTRMGREGLISFDESFS